MNKSISSSMLFTKTWLLVTLWILACDDKEFLSTNQIDQKINTMDMLDVSSQTDQKTDMIDHNGHDGDMDLDLSLSDQSTSDQSTSDQSTSDQSTSDQSTSDQSTSDQSTSDQSTSDQSTSDQSISDQMLITDPCLVLSTGSNGEILSGQILAEQLFRTLVQAYRPLAIENDLGGNPNRYTTARKKMFSEVYAIRNPQSQVLEDECVYTNQTAPIVADRGEPASDRLNCEHVFPREWMEQDRTTILFSHQESDLNNLAPSNPYANSTRGNLPYDLVRVADRESAQFPPSKRGTNASGDTRFEPQDETKGDLARVVLYFSIRWGIPLSSQSANHQAQEILKQWHHADPVDAFELERNQKVKALQGTFNPFIECPNFVDQIDFSSYTWSLSPADVMRLPNP